MSAMSSAFCEACGSRNENLSGPQWICAHCQHVQTAVVVDPSQRIDLRVLARRQRWLLWTILGMLMIYCMMPLLQSTVRVAAPPPTPGATSAFAIAVGLLFPLLKVGVLVMIMIVVVMVMAALRLHVVWRVLAVLSLFFPLANLLTLLFINRRVTRVLRDAGLRVGFMGVADEDVKRLTSGHLCRHCGYDLTGNVSGACPECGCAIAVPPVR